MILKDHDIKRLNSVQSDDVVLHHQRDPARKLLRHKSIIFQISQFLAILHPRDDFRRSC